MSKDGSSSFFTTKLDAFVNWGRKHSLWPLPFGTSCCGIEMMATLCSDYDMSRFGAEVVRFSPRQSDLLIVAGIFNVYSVLQGIDTLIPVDVYVPGCPPAPEGVIHALLALQRMVAAGETHSQKRLLAAKQA